MSNRYFLANFYFDENGTLIPVYFNEYAKTTFNPKEAMIFMNRKKAEQFALIHELECSLEIAKPLPSFVEK